MKDDKKIFLVITESGRVKRRQTFYIAEISKGKGLRLINNTFQCSTTANKGLINEAISVLIKLNELPENALTSGGYRNPTVNDYQIIHVESQSLAYVNTIN